MLADRSLMAAAGAQYRAIAVNFDGMNDKLTGGALTGIADSKLFSFSFWLKAGEDGVTDTVLAAYDFASPWYINRNSSNGITVLAVDNNSGTVDLEVASSDNVAQVADGWVHVMGSFDMSDTGKRHLYINDSSDLNVTTYTNDTLNLANNEFNVGVYRASTSSQRLTGDLADVWFEDGAYIDLSVTANRRKFIDANGKPVYLGASGELPTGTSPLVFLSGPVATWHTNRGTGGTFTETGALTEASTSPSD